MTEGRSEARREALGAIEALFRLIQDDAGKGFEPAEQLNQQAYRAKLAVREYAMKVRADD